MTIWWWIYDGFWVAVVVAAFVATAWYTWQHHGPLRLPEQPEGDTDNQ